MQKSRSKVMEPTTPLSYLIIFSILIALPLNLHAKITLEENCKRISGPNVPHEACMAVFKSDPGSKNMDLFGLGVIAFKHTIQRAADMKSTIEKQMSSAAGSVKTSLEDCLELYTRAVDTARETLGKFEARKFKETNILISSVLQAPRTCEETFTEMNVESPVAKENESFKQQAAMLLKITWLMGKKKPRTPKKGQPEHVAASSPATAGGSLEENCKKMVGANIPHEFCVAALGQDPSSKTADLFGLGVIAFKQTESNATAMKSTIEKLLKESAGAVKSSLEDCLEFYSNRIDTTKEALGKFEAKQFKESNMLASPVFQAASDCEDTFTEMNVQSPLTKENESFKKLAGMLLSVTRLMDKQGRK